MKFSGTVDIAAPRDKVWAFLLDPNQVGSCGPGVEKIEVIDDRHFKATAKVGVSGPPEGPTKMNWSADVTIAGTLASVGGRLIEGTANKMIGQTFECIRAKLEA